MGTVRVLMFPWLGYGHISPFLDLAKKLSRRNFYIYFCSTPVNLVSIKEKLSGSYSQSIQLVEFHLQSLPELPPHYHTSNGLPPHLLTTLHRAFENACPSFIHILKKLNPDLVIHDFMPSWPSAAAALLHIPAVLFLTSGASAVSFMADYFNESNMEFYFPDIHLPFYQITGSIIESSAESFILIRTFKEMVGKSIHHPFSLMEKKVVPVGPLLQDPADDKEEATNIVEWLNKKDEASSVLVSFGSEYFLGKEEMEEIAHGLVLSEVDFIWAVRFPTGEKRSIEDALPQGFLRRLGDKGMVIQGWVPQKKILGHSSMGGFVSHCGWSSVMEGMKFGVPIIAMPRQYDQHTNAKMLEAVGVGMEVKRDETGKVERGEIARVIKEVVVEKNGENVRRKAREMSETLGKKADEEIDLVVEKLKGLCI